MAEIELPERAKELIDAKNVGALTTLGADGTPHTTPVWIDRDGDDVLMSTTTNRVKARNLERDPRAGVLVIDPDNPVGYFSINGLVTLEPDEEKALLERLSIKYLGEVYPEEPHNVRVTIRLRPTRIIAQYVRAS